MKATKKRFAGLICLLCTCLLFAFAAVGCNPIQPPDPIDPIGPVDPDPTDPMITFADDASLNLTARGGERIDLPVATATDELDGDLSADVWVHAELDGKFATVTDSIADGKVQAQFVSDTAGTHNVYYEVENQYGLSDRKTVTVTVVGETDDAPVQFADITALGGDGGKYQENFADFKGDFVKDMGSHVEIKATADSIEGNSLFVDYGKGGTNLISTYALTSYFKSGVWKSRLTLSWFRAN